MTRTPRAIGLLKVAALSAAALVYSAAHADTYDLDFSNIYSFGELGNTGNATLSFGIGAFAHITGFGWNVNVTAFDPSWLSELSLQVTNQAGEGFELRPVDAADLSGTRNASGFVDLLNSGLAFQTQADGRVNLEFFEFYGDFANAPDGRWNSGTFSIHFAPVPEPTTTALFGAGLMTLLWLGSRRRPR